MKLECLIYDKFSRSVTLGVTGRDVRERDLTLLGAWSKPTTLTTRTQCSGLNRPERKIDA